jgi:hypothetical protein
MIRYLTQISAQMISTRTEISFFCTLVAEVAYRTLFNSLLHEISSFCTLNCQSSLQKQYDSRVLLHMVGLDVNKA